MMILGVPCRSTLQYLHSATWRLRYFCSFWKEALVSPFVLLPVILFPFPCPFRSVGFLVPDGNVRDPESLHALVFRSCSLRSLGTGRLLTCRETATVHLSCPQPLPPDTCSWGHVGEVCTLLCYLVSRSQVLASCSTHWSSSSCGTPTAHSLGESSSLTQFSTTSVDQVYPNRHCSHMWWWVYNLVCYLVTES